MALFENLRSLWSPSVQYLYGGDGVMVADMGAAQLYRTQPNLRAAIGFLADNAAQIPLKVYDRADDNDRRRVTDSTAAMLLDYPNPDMTPFEFKRWMYSDLLLYERFLMLLVPSNGTPSGWEMRPVPNSWIAEYKGASPFAPESVTLATGRGSYVEVPADKFVLFHGYDPNDPMRQCSRVSALKEILHEQVESNRFRRQMWRRGGRFNAYLTRPKDVQPWTDGAFDRFKETWKASWAGSDASDGGGMPILEDGMEIRTVQFNSRDAQWAESVKLAREDVAAVYRFNPALLWPGSGQTYASARDNARALYNDCLAPTLMQATDRLTRFVMPRVGEQDGHYVVYDIKIKTQGTFEERVSAGQTACGAPFMTRDEVRAEFELPAIEGGDELVTPLNVLVGGLASNHDTDPTRERYNSLSEALDAAERILGMKAASDETPGTMRKASGRPSEDAEDAMCAVYRRFFERQAKSVLPKLGDAKMRNIAFSKDGVTEPAWWDSERWNAELADDLHAKAMEVSAEAGERAASELWDDAVYDAALTSAYVRKMCARRAEMVNAATRKQIEEAMEQDDDDDLLMSTPAGVFENAQENRSNTAGRAIAAALVGWALMECVRQNRRRGDNVTKTWTVTSGNPRSSHARMNGETVPYDAAFSNGADWPGDIDHLDASEVANCRCVLDITIDR